MSKDSQNLIQPLILSIQGSQHLSIYQGKRMNSAASLTFDHQQDLTDCCNVCQCRIQGNLYVGQSESRNSRYNYDLTLSSMHLGCYICNIHLHLRWHIFVIEYINTNTNTSKYTFCHTCKYKNTNTSSWNICQRIGSQLPLI